MALTSTLALVSLNAIGGGLYGVTGAASVPRAWLVGSAFDSYFIPSLFLLIVVGGSCAVAAVAVGRRTGGARAAALIAGAILLAWIAAQVFVIGPVSWLQAAASFAGLLILVLAALSPSR